MQSIYLALYIGLYWNNSFRSHPNGVDRKPGMFTDNWTPQPHFNGLSMMTPVMDNWYLLALVVGWTMWRPYATELRRTVIVHVVFGCLIGFSPLERFMSIHRTIAMMPYFLFGHMLRRNKVFIPPAATNAMKAAAAFVLCVIFAGCVTAVYAFGWRSNGVWEQQISYHVTWETKFRWGPLIQLFAYLTTTITSVAFFALIPPASKAGVRDLSSSEGHKGEYQNIKEKDVVQIGGSKYTVGSPDDVEEELGASGRPASGAGPPQVRRGRARSDQAGRAGWGQELERDLLPARLQVGLQVPVPAHLQLPLHDPPRGLHLLQRHLDPREQLHLGHRALRHLPVPRLRRRHRAFHQARVHVLRLDPVPPDQQRLDL